MIDQVSSQYRKPSLISTSSYDIYNGGPSKPGISGYDPEEPDMRGVFMARGPGKLTKDLVLFYYLLLFIQCIRSVINALHHRRCINTYLLMYLFIIFILLVQSNLFLVLHHAVVEEEKVFSILKNQLLDLQFAHYT